MSAKRFSSKQLEEAEKRFSLRFPPDLRELLETEGIPKGYDWSGDAAPILKALRWPFEGLLFDIEEAGMWWPEWGERPDDANARAAVLHEVLVAAPRLIPLTGHRYLPQSPNEAGNPVFSIYQSDVIVYGAGLADWLRVESDPTFKAQSRWPVRHIPFWTSVMERQYDDKQFYPYKTDD